MRFSAACVVAAALLPAAGCVKVDVKVPDLGFGPGGDGGGGQASSPAPAAAPSQGWTDTILRIAGAVGDKASEAEHGCLFYAHDVVCLPGKQTELAASLLSSDRFSPIANVVIGFFLGETVLAQATTDANGRASVRWVPPAAGNYLFTARVLSVPEEGLSDLLKVTPAVLVVAARPKDDPMVLIDLDRTLVASSFFRVLFGGAEPMADSVEVTGRIAAKYTIVYLTHRPEQMARRSKLWLARYGYPVGAVLMSRFRQAIGSSGAYKAARIGDLRKVHKAVRIGIGDKLSDAQSYVDNGMTALLIPHYKDKPKDMRKLADEIEALRGKGRLHVVHDWRQAEAGVLRGASFPPESFARDLRNRADRIEAEKKRREKDDDDDDDD